MSKVKKLSECENHFEKEERIKELRNNIVKYSDGKYENKDTLGITVNWGWINYLELRFDNKKDILTLEMWIADVKHQWSKLSSKSSMKFLQNKSKSEEILGFKAERYMGAYLKLSDTFKGLKVVDFDNYYVLNNFSEQTYKNFYNTIGGQWKKDASKDDYVKGYRYLTEEVKELLLDNGKEDFISFIKNEKRTVLNLSLGTTIKISMPIQELAKKDVNFNKDNDELAQAIYDLIMKYKNEIEDKVRK